MFVPAAVLHGIPCVSIEHDAEEEDEGTLDDDRGNVEGHNNTTTASIINAHIIWSELRGRTCTQLKPANR